MKYPEKSNSKKERRMWLPGDGEFEFNGCRVSLVKIDNFWNTDGDI